MIALPMYDFSFEKYGSHAKGTPMKTKTPEKMNMAESEWYNLKYMGSHNVDVPRKSLK